MPQRAFTRILENISSDRGTRFAGFGVFLDELPGQSQLVLRNIFQLFHDMIHSYIAEIKDEYPYDPESIGFLNYNLDKLFIEGTDKPFFADRLFANRLIKLATSFRLSATRNKIFVFKGPAGSGKSTFLNNLLNKFESYVQSDQGLLYEVLWRLPMPRSDEALATGTSHGGAGTHAHVDGNGFFEVPCPSHDNPILLIPQPYRSDLLKAVIPDGDFKKRLFKHKQYQWVFKDQPCTICSALFEALAERYPLEQVYSFIFARRLLFNRRQSIGIAVFNSGDEHEKNAIRTNEQIQSHLNSFFLDSNKVKYLYSSYAHTNQGIMALMDLKARNIQRFLDLHGIISDEVHRVQDIEERIKSMFIVLMNPGDMDHLDKQFKKDDTTIDLSLRDRIQESLIPYVLDYSTEIKIYTNTFGDQIKLRFMPHVFENFAKVIVSSRIGRPSSAIKSWLKDVDTYEKYCDPDFYILKMDLYTGIIPDWLTKEDRVNLKADIRRNVIAESENEGQDGFSGRESNQVFDDFYSRFSKKRPITMKHLVEFFLDENKDLKNKIPRNFLKHLTNLYDFEVLKEMRDSMYCFNDEEINKTILNYLVAITMNPGDTLKNPYLKGEEMVVTTEFLEFVENNLVGPDAPERDKLKYREAAVNEYASSTLIREIRGEGKTITQTRQYQDMFATFTRNAREKILEPYVKNTNFRLAVQEYGSDDFAKYDTKLRERVEYLFATLGKKYQYDVECAKVLCLYVLDNNLVEKFGS